MRTSATTSPSATTRPSETIRTSETIRPFKTTRPLKPIRPSKTNSRFRLLSLPLAAILFLAALFAAFVLPFFFGQNQQPVYSATYPLIAENRVATVCLAALSVFVLLCSLWNTRQSRAAHPQFVSSPLTPRTVAIGTALVAFWTLALGAAVTHAHIRFGESAYFLERMRDMAASSGHIYTDVEFPYGPLLLLPPVWLARLGLPLTTGYFASLVVLNTAGILMTAFVLNRLPLAATPRTILFWLFCFEQANPLAGANYSLGKFMLPFAILLWGMARASLRARLFALTAGQLLVILVSPELGVGLGAAICGWAVLTAFQTRQPAMLAVCLAPPAGYVLFFAAYGRDFLDRLSHASAGALNLVIEPLPHILILIAALVFLAPLAVAQRLYKPVEGPALAGIYLLALGLLPGALGRSDPLHIFFNGFGFLLLAFVAVERYGRRWRWVWTAAVVLLCLQVQATNFAIYRSDLRNLAQTLRHPPTVTFDLTRLEHETAGQPIATPALMQLPLADELALRQFHLFLADKNPGLAEIWTPTDEQAKILRLRHADWALLPVASYLAAEGSPNTSPIKRALRLGYRYPERRPPYVVGRLLEHELAINWQPVDHFGNTILYRRLR